MAVSPADLPLDPDSLDAAIRGHVIRPGDDDYDTARRGHNLLVDARPALIVRTADQQDVATAIRFATRHGLELAVRGGGHSAAGHSTGDGVLVVDLSEMKGLHIDPDRRLVRAEPGLTAGEVTRALAPHGLAIPFGDTPTVGIAGLTLGGGIGYLARKHGLTIDHLVAAELVTADGVFLTASETAHADLFWAIRGGGGNFGVVTRFIYRAVPVDLVVGGALALPATPDVLLGLLEAAEAAPEGLSLIADVMAAPPLPGLADEWLGKPIIFVTGVFEGDEAAGTTAWAPIRAHATPLADLVGPMPYPAIYEFTEEAGIPAAHHLRSAFLERFDRPAAEVALQAIEHATTPGAIFELRVLGAAVSRVPADATAFAHRDGRLFMAIITFFGGDPEPHRTWTDDLFDALRPLNRGVYANFVGDEGEARVREAYPEATYDRLAAVKAQYDPANVFRRNQNIRPAG